MKREFVGYGSFFYINTSDAREGVKDVQFSTSKENLPLFKPCVAIFGEAVNASQLNEIYKGIARPETSLVSEWTTDGLTPARIVDCDGEGWEVQYG